MALIGAFLPWWGFDVSGIAPATDTSEQRYFPEWIAAGHGGELLDEEALHVRAHVGRLAQLSQLLGQVADVTSMIRPELPQLVGDEVVVAGADRLLVGP